jgi:tRNA C32,U32 (ribose-2'-O)-methylase TrmJ
MTRNLRNLFQRAQCTEQELRTLHGIITAMMGPKKRAAKAEDRESKTKLSSRRRPGPTIQQLTEGSMDPGFRRDDS